jgi:hypothetical protein
MPLTKRVFIKPATNETSNGFSHKNGNPVIQFTLPAVNQLLESSSLKLIANVMFRDANNAIISQNGDNNSYTADGGNANLSSECKLNMPNFGGVHNMIEKLVIKSKKTKVDLVNDNSYAHYKALNEAYSFNSRDYLRSPLNRSLSTGINGDKLMRRLVSVNGNNLSGNQGHAVTLKLDVALLRGYMLNMGDDALGGLDISIYLAPDSSVLHSRYRVLQHSAGANNVNGFSYLLKNVKLVGRMVIPAKGEKMPSDELILSGRTNFINDIHSSVNSSSYTPQLSFVRSIINNFQRQDNNNNYTLNSVNFPQCVGLQEVVHSKNGVRFPYDFTTTVQPTPQSSGVAPANIEFEALLSGDSEVRLHYERAILGGYKPYHSSATLELTQNNLKFGEYATAVAGQDYSLNVFPDVLGIGADYTMSLGMVQNFQNQDYSLFIKSGVNTGDATLPTTTNDTTLTQNTYTKNIEILDTKSLVMSK